MALLKNLNRIKNLSKNKKISIDNKGINRIVNSINHNKKVNVKKEISNIKPKKKMDFQN